MTTVADVFAAAQEAILSIHYPSVVNLANRLRESRRVFTVGHGGSAGHASHCACDLTKLAGIPSICLTDNSSAYSAGVNDDGSEVFVEMLRRYRFDTDDFLLIFSVGGGSLTRGVSVELVQAAKFANGSCGAIVGLLGDICEYTKHVVHIECKQTELVTYVVESVMPLVWHALVAGPLKREEPVWR